MAGGFIAIGSCISSTTQNQVIAFILSVVICFLFLLSGTSLVLDFFNLFLHHSIVDTISSLSALTHFSSLTKGNRFSRYHLLCHFNFIMGIHKY